MGRQPCCDKSGLKRGPWTIEEDQKLINFIVNNGIHCWRLVPNLAGLMRCGKSCRLRWTNYLRPDLKRGAISEEEENQIIQLHSRFGNRWSKIASYFPGRTDNEIKNHWNTRIKRRFKLLGLDQPATHKIVDRQSEKSTARAHHQVANFSPQAIAVSGLQQSESTNNSGGGGGGGGGSTNNSNAQEMNYISSSGNLSGASLCNPNPSSSSSSSSMEGVLAAMSDPCSFPIWEATYPLEVEDLLLYENLL